MFEILKKRVIINEVPLYDAVVSKEMFVRDWDIKSGEWRYEDGWLYGKNPESFPGMIVSKKDFFGDVMVDFIARTVAPSTHDINVMWNGSWDETKDERGIAYVAGVQGWWGGKVGVEKSPKYKLNVGTPLFDFVPGKEYHIQAGSVNGHCFIRIDGKLILEVTDPDPIDNRKHGKVGFEAYSSYIAIKDIHVFSLSYETINMVYEREF